MNNDTTFVCMRSGDHLIDAKNVEKRQLASWNLTFKRIAINENGLYRNKRKRFSQNERRRADLQNIASNFFALPQDLNMIFQS